MCGTVDTFINSAQDLGESLRDGTMQKYSRGSPMLLTPLPDNLLAIISYYIIHH